MSDLPAIITAAAGGLGVLGGGVRFLWNKIEKRFLDIENAQKKCEAHRATQITVIELLWQELKRLSPDAAVFDRAKKLLDGLKKGDYDVD